MNASPKVRQALAVLLALFLAWAAYKSYGLYRLVFPNRSHAMIPALQDMQTYCVGRYLIDLPRGSQRVKAISRPGGENSRFSAEFPVSHREYEFKASERWIQIINQKPDKVTVVTGPPTRSQVMTNAQLFTFNHQAVPSRGVQTNVENYHDVEGYLWVKDTLYHFVDAPDKEWVISTMKRLQYRDNTDIPQSQGFCGARSFFPGSPEDGESTEFVFHLPTTPRVEFRIGTMAGGSKKTSDYAFPDFHIKFVRDTRHSIGELNGEEWINSATSLEPGGFYTSSITARWQRPAGQSISRQPSINLKLDLNIDHDTPPAQKAEYPPAKVKGEIGKEEFITLWDGIINTLRPRPGAF